MPTVSTTRDTDDPSTGYLVWHLSMRWQVELTRALTPLGITHSDYGLLASLSACERTGVRPSQRELADASGLEPMHVSKLVRALAARGFVRREPHPSDPRALQLSLTPGGVDVVHAGREVVARLEAERLAAIGGPQSTRAHELRASLRALLGAARTPTG